MSVATEPSLNELCQTALRQLESAVKAGVKIQEQSLDLLTTWASQSPFMQAQQAQSSLAETMSSMSGPFQMAIGMMNKQAENAMQMLQQAGEIGRSADLTEAQEKTNQLWEATLGIVHSNVHSLLKTQTLVIERWRRMAMDRM